MKRVSLLLSMLMGIAINGNVIAQIPGMDSDPLDLNSITYIEEENEFELGFNTKDYLPLDFDPAEVYVNLNAIQFIEEDEQVLDFGAYLPHDFQAYSYPTDFRSIVYIDTTDEICLGFETSDYLPEGFDPYARSTDSNILSL